MLLIQHVVDGTNKHAPDVFFTCFQSQNLKMLCQPPFKDKIPHPLKKQQNKYKHDEARGRLEQSQWKKAYLHTQIQGSSCTIW